MPKCSTGLPTADFTPDNMRFAYAKERIAKMYGPERMQRTTFATLVCDRVTHGALPHRAPSTRCTAPCSVCLTPSLAALAAQVCDPIQRAQSFWYWLLRPKQRYPAGMFKDWVREKVEDQQQQQQQQQQGGGSPDRTPHAARLLLCYVVMLCCYVMLFCYVVMLCYCCGGYVMLLGGGPGEAGGRDRA